ncbi:MAG: hypothetical protein RL243_981 [Actinomycetota bacterium]
MTSSAKTNGTTASSKNFIRAILAVAGGFVLAVAGVIFYGTVTRPAENKAKDVAACKVYLVGYQKAKVAFVKEETAKDHTPKVETAVKAYADALVKGYNGAFDLVGDVNGTVGKGLKQLALARLQLDTQSQDAMASSFSTLDNTAATVEQVCSGVLDSANVKGSYGVYSPAPVATKSTK